MDNNRTYAQLGHNHDDKYYTEKETDAKLDLKSPIGHEHDDRYYTETETNALLLARDIKSTITYALHNGVLINLFADTTINTMITIRVKGNGYGDIPIDTIIQAYHTTTPGTFFGFKQINKGGVVPAACFFLDGGYVKCWFDSVVDYQTLIIDVYTQTTKITPITITSATEPVGTGKVTCALTTGWHSDNDGASSGLDADLLDGMHGYEYMPRPKWVYNAVSGILIDLYPSVELYKMLTIRIIGNSYISQQPPIDTLIQFYQYTPEGNWYNYSQINNGYALSAAKIFLDGGRVKVWIGGIGAAQTHIIECYHQTGIITPASITNATEPVGTNKVTCNLITGWNSFNDGTGSGLDADTVDGKHASELWQLIYPIGSIYMSVVNTNPGTLFGGTWVQFAAGRVIIGQQTADTDFDTAEETGGAKTHNHTLSAHTHTMAHTHTSAAHTHPLSNNGHARISVFAGSIVYEEVAIASRNFTKYKAVAGAITTASTASILAMGLGGASDSTTPGATGAASNGTTSTPSTANTNTVDGMPPYIVAYIWKRTA